MCLNIKICKYFAQIKQICVIFEPLQVAEYLNKIKCWIRVKFCTLALKGLSRHSQQTRDIDPMLFKSLTLSALTMH